MAEQRRFFWGAAPLQALAESGLIGGLLWGALLASHVQLGERLLSQSIFFLIVFTTLWYALRLRVPRLIFPEHGRGIRRQRGLWQMRDLGKTLGYEVLAALGLSPLVMGLWLAAAYLLGFFPLLRTLLYGSLGIVLILMASAPLFLGLRAGVQVWLLWERLRQRRLVWALTHTQLQLVLLFAGLAGVAMAFALVIPTNSPFFDLDTWVFTILPFLGIGTLFTLVILVAVIPPALLLAWLTARRTTRRLEALTAATTALREGAYATRAPVQGQDEVAQLQSDFNAMAAAMEQALTDLQVERDKVAALLDSRRQLVAGVSHELRTPLATLRGYLESLQQTYGAAGSGHDPVGRDLDVMGRELDRLQRLIDDLFTLARAEAGGLPLDIRPLDLGDLVRRRVEVATPLAWQRDRVQILVDLPETLPAVSADEAKLEQVLVNLLRNALRHTPPGGIVAVSVEVEGAEVVLRVCDTGEGIPEDEQGHIWERFYRGEAARTVDPQGAGLGLALVKELAEAMGGWVAVQSTLGTGSCFTVGLPQA